MNNLDNWDNFYTPYQGVDPITTMMSSFTISQNFTNAKNCVFKPAQLDKSYETQSAEENSSDDCGPHSLLCNELDVFTTTDQLPYEFPIDNRSHTQTFSSSSSPLSSTDQNIFSPVFLADYPNLRPADKFYSAEDQKNGTNVSNLFRNQFTFDNSQSSKGSDSTLIAIDGTISEDKDHELEVLDILKEVRENSSEYSRKVFIGGVPEGMSAKELCDFFSRFGEVKVDWPHRKQCDEYPKGYAFLIYSSADSVPAVIESCVFFQGRLCIQMEDSSMRPKTVQVRPWRNADRLWKDSNIETISARYSVFLGGVPRTATACQLANLINGYIGNVVAVNIEVDIETEYPKGAARVIFSKRESYITAIAKRHIGIFSSESQKEMEMKPFLEENMICESCSKAQTRNFCAELRCLLYICDKCWPAVHKNQSTHEHKPMQKGSFFGKTACADEIRKVSRRVSSSSKEADVHKERRGCDMYQNNNYVFQENYGHAHAVENKPYLLNQENPVDYSRKVFVGGLPEGLTADEICEFFSVFGHVTVDWPHRERSPHMPRAGYAFLVFANVESVRRLVSRCVSSPGKLCLKMTFPENFVEKIVQIRPWCKADRFWVSGKYRGTERYAIFMGGVPRTSTAADLAAFLFQEIGEVLSVGIEVENSTEYPKGAARAVFANREQYVYAIRLSQIAITSIDQQKTVELKPYLEESMLCEGCGQAETRNFCADLDCLIYLCECCWDFYHSEPYSQMHKPMLKGAFFPSRNANMPSIDDFHTPEMRPEWEYQTRNYSRTSQNCDNFYEGNWLNKRIPAFCGKNTKRTMI